MKFTQWQQTFTRDLFNGLSTELSQSIYSPAKHERFAVYQNNVFYSLTTALMELYPTVHKLVGDDFFAGTANIYIRQHPPQQAAMVHFGQDFPDFLRSFEHTAKMPYLADVASLEVARQLAYHADDKPSLAASDFSNLQPEAFEQAQCSLHPSVQMLSSIYPIFDIWQANRDDTVEDDNSIDLNEPQWVLIVRPAYELNMFNVDAGTYRFIELLAQKSTVAEALSTALEHDQFEPATAISLAIQHGFITEITTNSGE